MLKEVRIGAIGVGSFMARQHLPNILSNPAIKIHALCDLNQDLLRQRQDEYKPAYITADADRIFKDPEIDAILVGTRSRMHAPLLLKAAKAGKHVYVEKPMTMSYEETRTVLDAVKDSPINVGIGFNRRFAPAMVEAKKLFHRYKKNGAHIYYRIVDDHRIRPRYIFSMDDGGGHLLQEGCHIFDLLSWFLEAEPVEIYCTGPMETDNIAIIKYDDGSLATIICGGKGGLFYPKESMEVFCDNKTLVIDNFYELRFDGACGNFIRQFPLSTWNQTPLDEDNMTGWYKKEFASRPPHDIKGEHKANGIPRPLCEKGHGAAMTAFADAIVNGKRFSIGAVDGARATVCALKAYQSIKENRPISIFLEEYCPMRTLLVTQIRNSNILLRQGYREIFVEK